MNISDIFKEIMGEDAGQNATRECKNLLTKHLAMNERAWELLQNNGVTADDQFCLNFRFAADNHACGEALKDFICRKTDYTVHKTLAEADKKNWIVQGTTWPVKISREIIDQWVSGMVKLGLQFNCKFCGWWIWKLDRVDYPSTTIVGQSLGSIPGDKPG